MVCHSPCSLVHSEKQSYTLRPDSACLAPFKKPGDTKVYRACRVRQFCALMSKRTQLCERLPIRARTSGSACYELIISRQPSRLRPMSLRHWSSCYIGRVCSLGSIPTIQSQGIPKLPRECFSCVPFHQSATAFHHCSSGCPSPSPFS